MADATLWRRLKRVPVENTHFRCQVPIGTFVAEFDSLSHSRVVEVDGGHHGREPFVGRDQLRTAWLEGRGFRVPRFTNANVMHEIDSVLDTIHAALYQPTITRGATPVMASAGAPTPNPSPQG